MTRGVFLLLLGTLLDLALLPGRLVWAALCSGQRRRQTARLILGPSLGSIPNIREFDDATQDDD